MKLVTAFLTLALGGASLFSAEVFEIGDSHFSELPRGKEADGIVGDFVLRNDKIEIVISGNLPLRRPNMSAFYGDGNETPGCLYDLTLRDANNDQITIFTPCGQRGPVNYVKIADAPEGQVAVETVVTAAKGNGLGKTHRYFLKDGWQGVLIVSEFRNESEEEKEFSLSDGWTQMRSKGSFKGIQWADSIDPSHKCGYAFAWVDEEGATIPKSAKMKLAPGKSLKVARFLAVGTSPAQAVGIVEERRNPDGVSSVTLMMKDSEGTPVTSGRATVQFGDSTPTPAYPDETGRVSFLWSKGSYDLSIEDIGRETVAKPLEVNGDIVLEETLSPLSQVTFAITAEDGSDIPCKVHFTPMKGTQKPNLGPTDRAHGCVDQWHSETGKFIVPLPAGEYRVTVVRGPEYDTLTKDIVLAPGGTAKVAGKLIRSVNTNGWVSCDFHNHSTPSGDNTCGTDDRLINLAVEHIEFAPTTEHNRLYDWEPHIAKLGLKKFLATVPGMELTGRGAHFNTFPLKPDPKKQDGGAPVWQKDPRLNAIVLRNYQGEEADRWVHVNHPDMSENFIDWNRDGRADGGYAYFGGLLDGLETQNYRGSNILEGAPFSIGKARTGLGKQVNYHREFIWLQLLNQGLKVWGIGVADAHHVYGNGVGSWRTYIPSPTDDPEEIDWREISRRAKAGNMILSSGPFLKVQTGNGTIAGGYERSTGKTMLKVKVSCANWYRINRVQVLINGRQDPRYNYTLEKHSDLFARADQNSGFEKTVELDLSEDSHIIVVAIGEKESLQRGFGTSSQASIEPCAYNNPIFIDVDGNGFQPNGDTLGYELPVVGLSVDKVEAMLGQ
ncbi:MAG: CehA/McbA family metallohydrolase [Verrucomicrobiales bacterium]|nr:CehA/McbA family metallohydrolase [Verrucomicrobiales bacterium]